jgi:hypothetical protein
MKKICQLCGNEIEGNLSKCPHCGQVQKILSQKPVPKPLKVFNIKIGLPTVSEALRIAKGKMNSARHNHVKIVKLVHGYGSTGKGGKIRVELRRELLRMKNDGILHDVIFGEDFTTNNCKQLFRRFPELKEDEDKNRGNKGITLVEL